eukprot:365535-Chlamydomonas_euryale.AAC.98
MVVLVQGNSAYTICCGHASAFGSHGIKHATYAAQKTALQPQRPAQELLVAGAADGRDGRAAERQRAGPQRAAAVPCRRAAQQLTRGAAAQVPSLLPRALHKQLTVERVHREVPFGLNAPPLTMPPWMDVQVVAAFLNGRMSGIGDALHHLELWGYRLEYEQDAADRFDYTVASLQEDLRSGIRLAKLYEVLTGMHLQRSGRIAQQVVVQCNADRARSA